MTIILFAISESINILTLVLVFIYVFRGKK